MESEYTANLDYEAEYNRILGENKALRERMLNAEAKLKETYSELDKLQAQMEVVRLIFGGK